MRCTFLVDSLSWIQQFFIACWISWLICSTVHLPSCLTALVVRDYAFKDQVRVMESKSMNRIESHRRGSDPWIQSTIPVPSNPFRNYHVMKMQPPRITSIVVIVINRTVANSILSVAAESGTRLTAPGNQTQTYPISSDKQVVVAAMPLKSMLPYRRRLPQAIIIGVKKGGTRALLEFLKIHPDVRARGPESHFFDKNFQKGFEWYRRQMPVTDGHQLTLEKTPSYFITRGVPQRIRRMSPNVRLIIVVRDPVTRAVSDYAQAVTKRPDIGPFEGLAFLPLQPSVGNGTVEGRTVVDESWGPVRIGLYARHLERWLTEFPIHQMHFVSGENLVRNPANEMERVERFLGLRRRIGSTDFQLNTTKGFPCIRQMEGRSTRTRCLGKTKGRAHPTIDPDALKRLTEFFRPFNRKFYELSGIDFGWM